MVSSLKICTAVLGIAIAAVAFTAPASAGSGKVAGFFQQGYSFKSVLERNVVDQRAIRGYTIRKGKIVPDNITIYQSLTGTKVQATVNCPNGNCSDITVNAGGENTGDITGTQDIY